MVRHDERNSSDMRVLASKVGEISRSDGSARFSQGKTSVLVSVYGPLQANRFSTGVNVSVRSSDGTLGYEEKEMENVIRRLLIGLVILDDKKSIDISVQIIENDGSLLATSINGVMLACMDAGIPMSCIIAATSSCINGEGLTLVDPTLLEEKAALSTVSMAFSSRNVAQWTLTKGVATEQEFFACAECIQRGTQSVQAFYRASQVPSI